jgi:methanogenic corrinoid protein MtbC1
MRTTAESFAAESTHAVPFARDANAGAPRETGATQAPLGPLVRTLQRDLIPRLAQAHRPALARLSSQDVAAFTADLLEGSEEALLARLDSLRQRGFSDESLCMDLLTPAARLLGSFWTDDRCDFATVTIGVGQLQRLLRRVGPGRTVQGGTGLRPLSVLLVQPPQEQHSFGLSMVADFFRAAGWAVSGGVGDHAVSPRVQVGQRDFDVVGFSCGSQVQLAWLKQQIPCLRQASRNPQLVVMVGGPLFSQQPETLQDLGADLYSADAHQAPALAERLVRHARVLTAPSAALR